MHKLLEIFILIKFAHFLKDKYDFEIFADKNKNQKN